MCYNILIMLSLSVILASCGGKDGSKTGTEPDQSQPQQQPAAPDPLGEGDPPKPLPDPTLNLKNISVVPGCTNSSYLGLAAQASADKKDIIFKALENHEFNPSAILSGVDKDFTFKACKKECNDENINRVYESLLAKNILLNPSLNKEISDIYRKILKGWETRKNKKGEAKLDYNKMKNSWANDTDETVVLPVSQKFKIPQSQRIIMLETGDNPALQLDFILFNAKLIDKIGIGKILEDRRQYFYKNVFLPLRGIRTDLQTDIKRKDYGIANFDDPLLVFATSKPWTHWGRDLCRVNPTSSTYNLSAANLEIPIACGISGSTILSLWSVLSSRVQLEEDETRLLLLSIWTALGGDGGHTLQEVLSAVKYNSGYMKGLLAPGMFDKDLRDKISLKTLNNMAKVTDDINALGDPKEKGSFGRYYDAFFSKIKNAGFAAAREKAQAELLDFYKRMDCQNASPIAQADSLNGIWERTSTNCLDTGKNIKDFGPVKPVTWMSKSFIDFAINNDTGKATIKNYGKESGNAFIYSWPLDVVLSAGKGTVILKPSSTPAPCTWERGGDCSKAIKAASGKAPIANTAFSYTIAGDTLTIDYSSDYACHNLPSQAVYKKVDKYPPK